MKFKVNLFFALFFTVLFCACSDSEKEGTGGGLIGWYTDLSKPARASDFNVINQAINNAEILSEYRYGGSTSRYIATRDLFFEADGRYTDHKPYFGRLRSTIVNVIYSIRIIDNSTLIHYCGMLYDDGARGAAGQDAIYRIYAGPIFGNLTYYSEGTYYTYIRADNKLILSNGTIYTIMEDGLRQDGSSTIMRKYDPTIRY